VRLHHLRASGRFSTRISCAAAAAVKRHRALWRHRCAAPLRGLCASIRPPAFQTKTNACRANAATRKDLRAARMREISSAVDVAHSPLYRGKQTPVSGQSLTRASMHFFGTQVCLTCHGRHSLSTCWRRFRTTPRLHRKNGSASAPCVSDHSACGRRDRRVVNSGWFGASLNDSAFDIVGKTRVHQSSPRAARRAGSKKTRAFFCTHLAFSASYRKKRIARAYLCARGLVLGDKRMVGMRLRLTRLLFLHHRAARSRSIS